MAELLGIKSLRSDDFVISEKDEEMLINLHKETKTVLQIILSTGLIEPGLYETYEFGFNWRKIND